MNPFTALIALSLIGLLDVSCGKELPFVPPPKAQREDVVTTTTYVSVPTVYDSSLAVRFSSLPKFQARLSMSSLPSNTLKQDQEFPIFRYTALADPEQDTYVNVSQGRYIADNIEGMSLYLGAYEDSEFQHLSSLDTFIDSQGFVCYVIPRSNKTYYLEYTAKIKKVMSGGMLTFYINGVGKEVLKN